MGMNLHRSIITFFHDRMNEHDRVSGFERIPYDDEIVYQLKRVGFGGSVNVWLSDAYHFKDVDFFNKPSIIGIGDYIIIAKPEGSFDPDYEVFKQYKVGVGKIKKFMGALNVAEPWRFLTLEEREKLGINRL